MAWNERKNPTSLWTYNPDKLHGKEILKYNLNGDNFVIHEI